MLFTYGAQYKTSHTGHMYVHILSICTHRLRNGNGVVFGSSTRRYIVKGLPEQRDAPSEDKPQEDKQGTDGDGDEETQRESKRAKIAAD